MSEVLSRVAQESLYKLGGPQAENEKAYQVRRRGAVKLLLGCFAIVGAYFAGAVINDQINGIECKPGTYTETAESGDTSWDIASGKADEFNVSTGEYLYQLQEDNPSLKDGLQVGEEYILRESCSR